MRVGLKGAAGYGKHGDASTRAKRARAASRATVAGRGFRGGIVVSAVDRYRHYHTGETSIESTP